MSAGPTGILKRAQASRHRSDVSREHPRTRIADRWADIAAANRSPDLDRNGARDICVSGGASPTSSRKFVPPLAASNRPIRRCRAPVNAPFSSPEDQHRSCQRRPPAPLIEHTRLSIRRVAEIPRCARRDARSPHPPSVASLSVRKTDELFHEAPHELRNLISSGIEREVACIEDVDFRLRHVAAIGLRF